MLKVHGFYLFLDLYVHYFKNNIIILLQQQDQFQRLLPTFIQVIQLTEWEETEYWAVVSAVFEGKQTAPPVESNSSIEKPSVTFNSALLDSGINNKVTSRSLHFLNFLLMLGLVLIDKLQYLYMDGVVIIRPFKNWSSFYTSM